MSSTVVLEITSPVAARDKVAVTDPQERNAKTLQIFAGAREIFFRDGFDGSSMNDIARAAGVSKGTLYVYFDSKEKLFEAFVRFDRQRQAEQLCRFDDANHDVRDVLQRFGTDLMVAMLEPDHMAHVRMVIGTVGRLPQIGQAFYEAGPNYSMDRLSQYLKAQVASGLMQIDDTDKAAQQFIELCKAGIFTKAIMNMVGKVPRSEIEARVSEGMDLFLHYYLKRGI